jgi:redox-sensitive bicupin YhaK (pirin superfamily)
MPVQLVLNGQPKDLGSGFVVRRVLPSAQRQAVGPFLFFDHFGPVIEQPDDNHDVRPHPHIGLATVTYLLDGAITHRDSLGSVQDIEPGAINWMTAGRGIVHSERRPARLKCAAYTNHGFQLWAGLPEAAEEIEPSFIHTPASAIPRLTVQAADVRVLAGEAFGVRSPVVTFSQTVYLDIALPANGALTLPALAPELALYPIDADLQVDGQRVPALSLAVLEAGQTARLSCTADVRLLVLGGEPLGHRFMWWNFVSRRKERIAQAARDWQQGLFEPVAGETESIPLPG